MTEEELDKLKEFINRWEDPNSYLNTFEVQHFCNLLISFSELQAAKVQELEDLVGTLEPFIDDDTLTGRDLIERVRQVVGS